MAEGARKLHRNDRNDLVDHHFHGQSAIQAAPRGGDGLFIHKEEIPYGPILAAKTAHPRQICIFFFQLAKGFPLHIVPLMNQQR
jgi:hypothetical protein